MRNSNVEKLKYFSKSYTSSWQLKQDGYIHYGNNDLVINYQRDYSIEWIAN